MTELFTGRKVMNMKKLVASAMVSIFPINEKAHVIIKTSASAATGVFRLADTYESRFRKGTSPRHVEERPRTAEHV